MAQSFYGSMPRLWPQQCRQNAAHAGPFSREGLCTPCRKKILQQAGKKGVENGGGRPRTSSYKKSPSNLSSARRTRKPARPTGSNITNKSISERRSLEHRWCFRCRRRQDHCREGGCVPFKYILPPGNLTDFLQTFDAPDAPMRRTSDCWDV